MVARLGGYYGLAFKGSRGVTQVDPLSSTVFIMMVNAVLLHWEEVMVESVEDQRGHRQEGRHQNSLFYADDGMVASLESKWLQGAFSTLVGMFHRLGLKTNAGKMAVMVYRLSQATGTHSETVYRRQTTGAGPYYRERQSSSVL